jgi:hypothetical protein
VTRAEHLAQAAEALTKAAKLADAAEYLSRGEKHGKAVSLAAVGTLWNDVARTHLELARALGKDEH